MTQRQTEGGENRSICLREPNGRIFEEGLFDSSEQNTIHTSGDVTGSTLGTVIPGVCTQVKQMPSVRELICNISQGIFIRLSAVNAVTSKSNLVSASVAAFLSSPAARAGHGEGNNLRAETCIVISLTELSKQLAHHASYT